MATEPEGPLALVQRLARATNEHDLEGLVDCFAADYRNETPAHPSRGFGGREQVRTNWEQIFRFVPDLAVEVPRWCVEGGSIWSEWRMSGTRLDGSAHRMAGVIIFDVAGGRASSARFYLEPVEEDSGDVNDAVRRAVVATDASAEPQPSGGVA